MQLLLRAPLLELMMAVIACLIIGSLANVILPQGDSTTLSNLLRGLSLHPFDNFLLPLALTLLGASWPMRLGQKMNALVGQKLIATGRVEFLAGLFPPCLYYSVFVLASAALPPEIPATYPNPLLRSQLNDFGLSEIGGICITLAFFQTMIYFIYQIKLFCQMGEAVEVLRKKYRAKKLILLAVADVLVYSVVSVIPALFILNFSLGLVAALFYLFGQTIFYSALTVWIEQLANDFSQNSDSNSLNPA
jgi:hypothetical protein